MNWQVASLSCVGVVLTIGFAWYERSRPPAKVLALVAALVALATIGRIAFAPLPNVKPTTDIALFAGYSLGAVPGFAVGALAALVSNFFFGQGPWTPWQMLAWGIAGVGGGVLARTFGRDLGRVGLALACGLAGAVFGAIMDLFQLTAQGSQDLAHYLAVSAASATFNAAHVAGNIAFCLLLGPAFVRALTRYRRRFEIRWAAPAMAILLAAVLVGAGAVRPAPAMATTTAAERALSYLAAAQNSDGGFGPAPGTSSTQLDTGWVALGVAAAGRNPLDFRRAGSSAIDYARVHAGELTDTGDLERTILMLAAAGVSPRAFAGQDLVAELLAHRSGNGSFEGSINHTAFGALALRAAAAPGVAVAGSWLARQQNVNGGFGFDPRAPSDVDDTGAVLEALGAAGRAGGQAAQRAVRFLVAAQGRDGGFGQRAGDPSNVQSTAWAVQGLVAAGVNPYSPRRGGRSPLAYIESLQASDGSIRYSRSSSQTPVWVTAQALDALERQAFPLGAAARRSSGALAPRPHHRAPRRRSVPRHVRHPHPRAAPAAVTSAPPPSAPAQAPVLHRAASNSVAAAPDGPAGAPGRAALALAALALLALGGSWWFARRRRRRA